MGKIVVSTNVTLDGVVQDPDGHEGFDRGGWFDQHLEGNREAWTLLEFEEAKAASAFLLGRSSDEWFGSRWSARTGEWADRLNELPKYVISSTVDEAVWTNGTVLAGDVIEDVRSVREHVAGDIIIYASYQLVQALLDHDLVDEFRLTIFPVIVGGGRRLFGTTEQAKSLVLAETRKLGEGLVFVRYEVAR
jgi:dihydrofolate reductase